MPKTFVAAAIGFCIALSGSSAFANCKGDGYFERLDSETRRFMIEDSNKHDFHTGLIFQAVKGEQTYYIIASNDYHDARNDLLWPEIDAVFDMSKGITFSHDYPTAESFELYAKTNLDKVIRSGRPTTNELMPSDVWKRLLEAGKKRGIDSIDFMVSRPWLILEGLAKGPCRYNSTEKEGLTEQIWQEAKKRGFEIAHLESWDAYLSRYDRFTEEELLDRISAALVFDEYADTHEASYANLYYQGKLGLLVDLEQIIWSTKYATHSVKTGRSLPKGRFKADLERFEDFKFKNQSLLWPLILNDREKQWPHILVIAPQNLPSKNGLLFSMHMDGFNIRPIR